MGHIPALRDAQTAVDAVTATGDQAATAFVFKYETTGPVAGVWGLWRVLDADRTFLRAWDDDPDSMTDESEEELVALDLISNHRATQDYTDFGTLIGSTVLILHTLAL